MSPSLSVELGLSAGPGGGAWLHLLRWFPVLRRPLEPRPRAPPGQLRLVGVLRPGEEVGQSDELQRLQVRRNILQTLLTTGTAFVPWEDNEFF